MNEIFIISKNEGYEIRMSCGEFEESDPCQDLDGSVVWHGLEQKSLFFILGESLFRCFGVSDPLTSSLNWGWWRVYCPSVACFTVGFREWMFFFPCKGFSRFQNGRIKNLVFT